MWQIILFVNLLLEEDIIDIYQYNRIINKLTKEMNKKDVTQLTKDIKLNIKRNKDESKTN